MEEAITAIVEFARQNGIGYWDVVLGISVVVMASRSPDLLRSGGEFVNERKRINDTAKLKQDQVRRSIQRAQERRKKEGPKK